MTDAQTQALARSDRYGIAHLRTLQRAGGCEMCTAKLDCGVPCGGCNSPLRPCNCQRLSCSECAGTGNRVTVRLQILAYCGHKAAREIMPTAAFDESPFRTCADCGDTAQDAGRWDEETGRVYCGTCGCGQREFDINEPFQQSAEQARGALADWLSVLPHLAWDPQRILVVAAVAAAGVALPLWDPGGSGFCSACGGRNPNCNNVCKNVKDNKIKMAGEALRAAEAWVACPCEGHALASANADDMGLPVWAGVGAWIAIESDYLYDSWYSWRSAGCAVSIEAAARLAGENVVRDAIFKRLISWTLRDL